MALNQPLFLCASSNNWFDAPNFEKRIPFNQNENMALCGKNFTTLTEDRVWRPGIVVFRVEISVVLYLLNCNYVLSVCSGYVTRKFGKKKKS